MGKRLLAAGLLLASLVSFVDSQAAVHFSPPRMVKFRTSVANGSATPSFADSDLIFGRSNATTVARADTTVPIPMSDFFGPPPNAGALQTDSMVVLQITYQQPIGTSGATAGVTDSIFLNPQFSFDGRNWTAFTQSHASVGSVSRPSLELGTTETYYWTIHSIAVAASGANQLYGIGWQSSPTVGIGSILGTPMVRFIFLSNDAVAGTRIATIRGFIDDTSPRLSN